MSERPVELPKTLKEGTGTAHEREVTTHPAYAQIVASRRSGSAHLYDSDFNHQHFVTITVKTSELHRHLSNDWHHGRHWHHGRQQLLELSMSEAQWASFISSMNVGEGVCCTLDYVMGKEIPRLPNPEARTHQFSNEVKAQLLKATNSLLAIAQQLEGPINKTTAARLQKDLMIATSNIPANAKFIADQFDEHMENTVEKAKIEINAYATGVIQRAGLQAIANGQVLEFSPTKDSP